MFKSSNKLAQFTIIHKNSNCYKDYHILKINTTLLMHKTDDVNWNRIQKGMFILVHSWAVMRKTKLCITFYYWERKIIVLIVEVNEKNHCSFWEFNTVLKDFLSITKNVESKMFYLLQNVHSIHIFIKRDITVHSNGNFDIELDLERTSV